MLRLWTGVIAGLLVFSGPALACSVVREYVVPTNFELVQIADAIVVATPEAEVGSGHDTSLTFRIDEVLKGDAPELITIARHSLGDVELSNATSLAEPNSEAMSGSCIRRTFRAGQQAVLFLGRGEDGELRQIGYPFARVNEDYFGADALWPRTIRLYLDIQAHNAPMRQLEVLADLLEREAASTAPESRELARDIISHLMSRSRWKPTEYLVQTYEALESGGDLAFGLRPRSADREQSAAQALTDLMFGDQTPPLESVEDQQLFVLASLVNGDHPDALPLFEEIVSNEPSAAELGMVIRFLAKNGQLRRAYDLVEHDAAARLAFATPEERSLLISDIHHAMRGDGYEEGSERWRTDAYVADRWPERALTFLCCGRAKLALEMPTWIAPLARLRLVIIARGLS